MRELLFLAHRVPYPPDRGDKMRSFHLLQAAAKLAPVHLVAFADDDGDMAAAEALRPLTASLHVERRRRSRLAATIDALASRCPISVKAYASRSMHRAVDDLVAARPIDTILAFSSQTAQFALPHASGRRFVMDFVDVDSAKFADYAAASRGPARLIYRREANRLFRWERMVAARADLSLFVSEAEAAMFRARTKIRPSRVLALENGIDLARYDPAGLAPAETARSAGPLIVFTGQMDYRPNVEAVIGYASEVLPLIRRSVPAARFAIVGRRPVPAVRQLAGLPGVVVTGEVADVRGWICAADLVVAPLAIARGVQNKVLEAMAMARPVIASPAAYAGIDARSGEQIVVADGPDAQAEAAVALLNDSVRRDAIGAAARARVLARYRWEDRLAGLADILSPADERLAA